MAYTVLTSDVINDLNDQYKDLVAKNASELERYKVGMEVEKHLAGVARIILADFQQHQANCRQRLAAAEKEIKTARAMAASYKKNTTKTELPPQLKYSLKKLTDMEAAFREDTKAFGDAWFAYRNDVAKAVDAEHRDDFIKERTKVINGQKEFSAMVTKIKGYKQETEGLLQIAAKATMKSEIKRGGAQRPIADAQKLAEELADQMVALAKDLEAPKSLESKPSSITTSRESLVSQSKDKAWVTTPRALMTSQGVWKNITTGVKLLETKLANMEKVMEVKQRALRTNELNDPTVKTHLQTAAKAIKDSKALVKTAVADMAKAKPAYEKIEAAFKSAKKR